MKKVVLLAFVFLSSSLFGQTKHISTMSLLTWLVKKDHIEYLNTKSNSAVFYNKNILTTQTIINDSDKFIPNVCLKDYLSTYEVKILKSVPHLLMQTDWSIKYLKLKTKFVTDKFTAGKLAQKTAYTVYGFSEPIFLNKTNKRVMIGEYFTCGAACGRNDLLLCEFKNRSWQIIARAVISND